VSDREKLGSYDRFRADAVTLLDDVIVTAQRVDAGETLRRLTAARDRLIESRLVVLVCGEFKRGKSTLLNALLDQKESSELFPTGLPVTTSVVTTVMHGDTERISIRRARHEGDEGDEGDEELTIDRAELRSYVTEAGNARNAKRVHDALIELPSPKLASGLVLMDTPGIGGMSTEHSTVTNAALPLADAIVFVASAYQPLTSPEVRFLRRAIELAGVGDERGALICVLTRIDQEPDYEEMVADTRAKLAEVTGWPDIPVVPVSSTDKLRYLDSGDSADLEYSNFPALERALWDTVTRRRARAVLGGALQDLSRSVTALREPLDRELSALLADDTEAADAARQGIEDRGCDLDGFSAATANWRSELAKDAAKMGHDVLEEALRQVERAELTASELLKDNYLLDNIDELLQRVDEVVAPITSAADRRLFEQASLLQRRLSGSLKLDLGGAEISRLPAAPVSVVRNQEVPDDGARQSGTSKKSIGGAVGSVISRLIEIFSMPGMGGVFLGGGYGGALGMVDGLASWRATDAAPRGLPRPERVEQLDADLDGYFSQMLRPHLTTHVPAAAQEWATCIAAEIDSRIREERASVAAAALRINTLAPEDAEGAAAREETLHADLDILDNLTTRIKTLARSVSELASYGES
jgi:Dynamin family